MQAIIDRPLYNQLLAYWSHGSSDEARRDIIQTGSLSELGLFLLLT